MKHFIGGWAAGFIFLSFLAIRSAIKEKKTGTVDLVPMAVYAIAFGLATWGLWP